MKLYKSQGIVFRSTKYGESSLILDILMREKGLRSFIVGGVRKSKSKNSAAQYQHLNILDIVAYDKEDKLARIKECNMSFYYQNLPFDIVRSSIGLFILEVCKNAIKERESNIKLYDFIYNNLLLLDQLDISRLGLFPIKFMLDLSRHIGFEPHNNYTLKTPYFDLYNGKFTSHINEQYMADIDSSKALSLINSTPLELLSIGDFSKPLRNKLTDDLIIFYRLHIDQFRSLKTLEVLRSIF
ncbi:MAG: DNA repair protein RecO [Saprospiraceae bacterium]